MRGPDWPGEELAGGFASFETEERIGLMGQGLVNAGSKILLGLISIFLIPVMLRGLGTELFGLWLFASMVVNVVSTFADLGVHLTVIREVGAAGSDTVEVAPFVKAAANLYLRLAIAGALAIIVLGAALLIRGGTMPEAPELLAKVFIVLSVGFIADQMCSFQLSLLQGVRRFNLSNLLAISYSLFNALCIVGVLAAGGRLLGVVEAETLISILSLIAAYVAVVRLVPRFRQSLCMLNLEILRPHLSFSLLSQLSILANSVLWNGPPMLIGLMLGPAGLVPYQLGCKFPLAVGNFAWELAAVLMPVASRHQRTHDVLPGGQVFEAGTRWVTVLTLPIFIILWIVGPDLLGAWLGRVPSGALLALRLMTLAATVSATDVTATSILLGRGMVGFLSAASCGVAGAALPLTALLLERIGFEGAAWALLVLAPIAALIMLRAAAKACDISLSGLTRRIARDIWMPSVACACAALLVVHGFSLERWLSVIVAASAGMLAYFSVYFVVGARDEEHTFLRRGVDALLDLFLTVATEAYPAFHAIARFSGMQASNYPRLAAIVHSIRDPYRQMDAFDSEYATAPDHWGYTTNVHERERHLLAVRLLESVCPEGGFGRVLEIGCAEGVFTEMLAPLCNSLVAVDFSEIALDRARKRRIWGDRVTFYQWNVRVDPIPGNFEMIVTMDVLGYIRRLGKLRKVNHKLVSNLRSGDWLFAGDFRQGELFEGSWIAKRLRLGGKCVIEELATHPGLETVKTSSTESHVFAVLRKL